MRKSLFTGLLLLAGAGMASADITVTVAPGITKNTFDIEYGLLSDMTQDGTEKPESQKTTRLVENGKFTVLTMQEGPAQYAIPVSDREYIVLYTTPGDNLNVNIESISPLSYTVAGSTLMSDISDLDNRSDKILATYRGLYASGNPDPEVVEQLRSEYDKIFTDYIAANPNAAAVPYAILHLDGEAFITAYNNMTPEAAQSPIAVLLAPQKERVEKMLEKEQHKAQLTSGNVMAPDFTFNDAEGNAVSLSQFLGKWVIIDFWGTWCPWCIKGFPELKEAYKEYKPELEIIGVACNDEYDAWKNGLKKYDLPWVNVYNPEKGGGKLMDDYAIEGFPTKALVNPEGVIVNITVGHNPDFFNVVKQHLSKTVE